jgi:AcrR family transcriptional regulator
MATKKINKELDTSTEAKIKAAARVVFHKNGFAATRTRDIAEEAGINLALLNYYFRSKQKLFDLIMMETMQGFFQSMAIVFNDEQTTLDQKVEIITERYIDKMIADPHVPIFLLNELRNNPSGFVEKVNMKQIIVGSVFFKQFQDRMIKSENPMHPLHFVINMMSLIMFPFVGSPIFRMVGEVGDLEFNKMMLERKALIPIWIKTMMS